MSDTVPASAFVVLDSRGERLAAYDAPEDAVHMLRISSRAARVVRTSDGQLMAAKGRLG